MLGATRRSCGLHLIRSQKTVTIRVSFAKAGGRMSFHFICADLAVAVGVHLDKALLARCVIVRCALGQ